MTGRCHCEEGAQRPTKQSRGAGKYGERNMRKTLVALLVTLVFPLASAGAAEHRLGLGAHYWRSLDDLGDAGLEEDGVAPFLTYQYVPEGIFRLELDLEYY